MSTMPIQSGNPLDQLARTLFRAYDTNSDGKLSSDEFATLVANLTGAVASAGRTATAAATSAVYTTPVLSTAAREPRSALEGFDSAKLGNLDHRTPKYLFARVAQYADLSGVTDKASAESVLRGMTADLQAAGLSVLDVKGDKIQVTIEGRDTWIDVVRGASSGRAAFQWLPIE